jgi:hypothetical protein
MEEDSFMKIVQVAFLSTFTFGIYGALYNQRKIELYNKEFEQYWKMDIKLYQLDREIRMEQLRQSNLKKIVAD